MNPLLGRTWQRAHCYLVIGSKIVNLLLEHRGPEVFTDELHDVQLIFESCCIFGQSGESKSCSNEGQKLVTCWMTGSNKRPNVSICLLMFSDVLALPVPIWIHHFWLSQFNVWVAVACYLSIRPWPILNPIFSSLVIFLPFSWMNDWMSDCQQTQLNDKSKLFTLISCQRKNSVPYRLYVFSWLVNVLY